MTDAIAVKHAGEWQDISTAPKGKLVILAFEYHPTTVGRFELGQWVYAFAVTEGGDSPTHWMHLPPKPAISRAEGHYHE